MDKHISFQVPISSAKEVTKSVDGEETPAIIIGGWASTATRDFQGESIDPIGIDSSYFVEHGWVDWEHDTDDKIGVPTKNTFTDGDKGLYVEAELFPDNPHVKDLMQLTKDLESIGSDRKIGFSIEGEIGERDSYDDTIIRSVWITGVAVTGNPANPDATWDYIQKSITEANHNKAHTHKGALEAGTGVSPETQIDGGALRPESIASTIINLSWSIGKMSPQELDTIGKAVAHSLDRRPDNPVANRIFLQIFKGLSQAEAQNLLSKQEG